jgi:AraC-like DNA-binding protein
LRPFKHGLIGLKNSRNKITGGPYVYRMYFTKLPDHSVPGFSEEHHFSLFNQHNIIFNATSYKSSCDNHVGCLSLKTVFRGEEWYTVDGVPFVVRPGQYLLLNEGQNYGSSIHSAEPVRSSSVFFTPQFAAAVYKDSVSKEQDLLDDPFYSNKQPEFYQKLHPSNGFVQQFIHSLVTKLNAEGFAKNDVDEKLCLLLHNLISAHHRHRKETENVAALKKSTRSEIYKRLCVARDVMQSCYDRELDLETISQYALLSVPQLVRQFKAVFKQTPHQYLMQVRLQQARQLLDLSNRPVTDITAACGFHDHSAFSRLFKRKFSQTPEQYRKTVHN